MDGRSRFTIYRDLGVRLYSGEAELEREHGMSVALQIIVSPSWADGGRSREWAPRPRAFADFAAAASRSVRHWMVWGASARRDFLPMP